MSSIDYTIPTYLKPGSLAEEKVNLMKTFSINNWQYAVILGIAVSGIAAFVNTYDAISNINKNRQTCTQTDQLKHELNVRFVILIILSCLALLIGLLMAWSFRTSENKHQVLTLGLASGGILGILYAVSTKFQNTTNAVKLGVSWISLAAFIILGFLIGTGKIGNKTPEITSSDIKI